MEYKFLSENPSYAPQIARWYDDEWGYLYPDNNVEKIIENILATPNEQRLPITIAAIDNDVLIGSVQLKPHEMKERFPERTPWLGGVFVAKDFRGNGVASSLCQQAIEVAKDINLNALWLQTESLDGGLYTNLGWKPIQEVVNKGVQVLVMCSLLKT